MEIANTLAYYNTAKITAVKCFIVQAPVYHLRAALYKLHSVLDNTRCSIPYRSKLVCLL
jgi:hypothetical protein